MFIGKKIFLITLLFSMFYIENSDIFTVPKLVKKVYSDFTANSNGAHFFTISGKYRQNSDILNNNTEKYTNNTNSKSTIRALVLLVEFNDVKFSINEPVTAFNNLINSYGYSYNGATGSVKDYFNANFYNFYNFEFDVSNVITLKSDMAKYGAATSSANDIDAKQMVVDACKTAYESGIDFSIYDCNKDGVVDNVHIIYAGYSHSCGGPTDAIWAHQWTIKDKNISYNGVSLASYSCSSELRGNSDTLINSIGSFCHEYLHSWGLIDMYDTNQETEGLSNALYGNLSIMDNGYELNQGNTPPFLNAIEREQLSIVEIIDIEPNKEYSLFPINISGKIGRIKTNTEGEYFLLECRSMHKWDKYIGGEGLIIYHIDKSDNIYGDISAIKRWEFNNINAFASHECAKVVVASNPSNGSISSIFFPGTSNVTSIKSSGGESRLLDWNGRPVGVALENITFKNNKVCFKSVEDYTFSQEAPVAKNISAIEYQESARIKWECDSASQNLKWRIVLKDLSNNALSEHIAHSTQHVIKNLESGAKYNLTINSLSNLTCGAEVPFSFSTVDTTSMYPHIFVKDEYKANETIDLRVFNISEPYRKVLWKINGQNIYTDYYVIPNETSEIEIIATILYKDGTNEKIYKTIFVQ